MISKIKIFGNILIITTGFYIFFYNYSKINFEHFADNENSKVKIENQQNIKKIKNNQKIKKIITNEKEQYDQTVLTVRKNQTFSSILENQMTSNKDIFEIINEVEKKYDLRKLNIGQKITFFKNKLNEIKKIELEIDEDKNLNIILGESIVVKKEILNKIFETQSNEFIIQNSLYLDGVKNNVPKNILIKLIRLFSFDLDFQRDIKKNTRVSVSYELAFISDRNKVKYQDIKYAQISIGNNNLEYFKFITDDGYIDYFNREGKNVKKSILKTPLDGARLSSTFGMRKHPILGYNKMHRGIDFAAPMGTPVYAGGNGTVEFAGRNGGYGKYIRIRHNNGYKTAYAHLSGYAKGIKTGVRVNQGDTIGYVGSTGRSTGPHLHYEIIFQDKQINPLKLKLPSGKILKGEEKERFVKEYKVIYANHLNLLFE